MWNRVDSLNTFNIVSSDGSRAKALEAQEEGLVKTKISETFYYSGYVGTSRMISLENQRFEHIRILSCEEGHLVYN